MPSKNKQNVVIAVDPGLNNLGLTVFDANDKILSSQTVKMTSKEAQESRLYKVFCSVYDAASGNIVSQVVSEKQFVEIMSVINGAIRAAAGKLGARTTLFMPSAWKKAATGKGNISEDDLRDYIISKYPEAKDFDEHMIDSVGVYLAYVKTVCETHKKDVTNDKRPTKNQTKKKLRPNKS
jgi:Holliday junction resolvasome RuvABC endonuclease subunit